MISLLTVACLTLVPQFPPAPTNPQQRFVDYSHELDNPHVSVLIGRLGKLKEGKRERMKNVTSFGAKGTSTSISGTQFYKATVRVKIATDEVLAGPKPKGRPEIETQVQIVKLPNGSEFRQSLTGSSARLKEDLLALWVVEKPIKGKRLQLRHVIPFHPKADVGKDPEGAFAVNMADFLAVNQRMSALQIALQATEDPAPKERALALAQLQALPAEELKLKNPKNDVLLGSHIRPLEKRVKDRIAELEKSLGGG